MDGQASSTDAQAAQAIFLKGKRAAADYVRGSPHAVQEILDVLLNPTSNIDDWETIDWCRWLIAGGRTPDEFSTIVRQYDNASTCGLVWTANFVAYRCRTCGISPCMSLCAECFQKGNHNNHDFNMFRSMAGGACDCGDVSVMKEIGFCSRHGPQAQVNKKSAPTDLLNVAEVMMPRIFLRLIHYFRYASTDSGHLQDADSFLTMILDFSSLGAAMRRVMASTLINPQIYKNLTQNFTNHKAFLQTLKVKYERALEHLINPAPPDELKHCLALQKHLVHRSFLEELMFWNIRNEFPQKMVCLLLNLLPEPDYKEALIEALVLHYTRISMMLERSLDPDALSNCVVHMSVQLFSNQQLALLMADKLDLLHVMIFSLKYMMSKLLIENTLHEEQTHCHFVIDCAVSVMKDHCYWPLVSDLNNVLSHRPVALKFMSDDNLLEMWFAFLSMFQGMNVNQREMTQHIEFEPNTYYAAFSAELEACAYPMWALLSHLRDESTLAYSKRVIHSCLNALQEWLDAINFQHPVEKDKYQVSFHLPLHRYLAVFMCQAIRHQGMTLQSVLPRSDLLNRIMFFPLRVQAAFYEIVNGLWVRNGLQIKGQAMTYIQCNFCNSMVDADLYLLQVCATQLQAQSFLTTILDQFHMKEWLSLSSYCSVGQPHLLIDSEPDTPMLESCLLFLATLVSSQSNLGEDEASSSMLEMVTLLCIGDKTHSQLIELMPERCGTQQKRDFESVLADVAEYRGPNFEASGNMQQGMYRPKAWIWDQLYNPIHVLLRAVHRRDFQNSMDRFTEHVQQTGKYKGNGTPWPPFRMPGSVHPAYEDPRKVLRSRVFHAFAYIVLYKAVYGKDVSDHVIALTLYLLEMALSVDASSEEPSQICQAPKQKSYRVVDDGDLLSWYDTDWLSANLRTVINAVYLNSEQSTYEESSSNDVRDHSRILPALTLNADSSDDGGSSSGHSGAASGSALLALPATETVTEIVTADGSPEDIPETVSSSDSVSSDIGFSSLVRNDRSIEDGISVHQSRQFKSAESMAVAVVGQMAIVAAQPEIVSGTEIVVASSSSGSCKPYSYRHQPEASENVNVSCDLNESIISLLLKLHSNLSEAPDSFNPFDVENIGSNSSTGEPPNDYIGDGPFFVGKLLRHIMALDPLCRENVFATREKLWGKKPDETKDEQRSKEDEEREERRRRAKERQKKLMEEFASQQKQFMAKAMETENGMDWNEEDGAAMPSKKEYDCAICNQTTLSTAEKPMGLVVLLQATSVLGHKRQQTDFRLPTTDDEQANLLRQPDELGKYFDKRIDILNAHFDEVSWELSLNLGWEGGVHLQTCGHHLHLECHTSYLDSLRRSGVRQAQSLDVDHGEYACPVCRQLANSVLPLSPELGECSAMVRARTSDSKAQVLEITQLLVDMDRSLSVTNLSGAMGRFMVDTTNCTSLKYRKKCADPTHPVSLLLFVTSMARTNLELELVQRGGSLCNTVESANSMLTPKRSCIAPLLHVLAMHARVLAEWPVWETWEKVALGKLNTEESLSVAPLKPQLPLLLWDPTALLIHFVLVLPLHIDQSYFLCVVKSLYNLLYFQVITQISCRLSSRERSVWLSAFGDRTPTLSETTSLEAAMALTIRLLEHSHIYRDASETNAASCSTAGEAEGPESCSSSLSSMPSTSTMASALLFHRRGAVRVDDPDSNLETLTEQEQNILLNKKALEQEVQQLCLPFLRIAALLRHNLYEQPLPDIQDENTEFVVLVYYLELVAEGMDWTKFNSAIALNWPEDLSNSHVYEWAQQLNAYALTSPVVARNLILDHHRIWYLPKLLSLPHLYDSIFQYHHRRQCSQCHSVPRETTLCLVCGTLVCFKENCCKQSDVCEAIQHADVCGAGTAVFLVVTSSCIIVIRGKRACLWGSVYLDLFGEEDRELKRGKPLFLSPERYRLLEQQWVSHRFDHTHRKWVWHRDSL